MLQEVINSIQPLIEKAMEEAQAHLDQLTKPQGSLGRLEELSLQIAGITGEPKKVLADKRSVIMAADHGVVAEGVSAFPQEVTQQMVFNFLQGGAAINVITRQGNAKVTCVDVGIAAELPHLEGLVRKKIAYGTKNMCQEPAMTREQAIAAIEAGIEVAFQQIEEGATLLATGEMGIGNTTASSAVLAALVSCAVEEVVGKGTGIQEEALQHKTNVIKRALALHQPDAKDPLGVLQKVGGLELCALAGLALGCAAKRVPIVVDGFITTVAVLCAIRLCPQVKDYVIPSHLSEEPGHRIALSAAGLKPMLHMNMRLGEGSGAALLFPIIDTAQRIMQEMATFAQAGVSEKNE
jgi:nicotinate-nucleotide--dimethylbenzimidazole phosphoribosyltransferase